MFQPFKDLWQYKQSLITPFSFLWLDYGFRIHIRKYSGRISNPPPHAKNRQTNAADKYDTEKFVTRHNTSVEIGRYPTYHMRWWVHSLCDIIGGIYWDGLSLQIELLLPILKKAPKKICTSYEFNGNSVPYVCIYLLL